ncbi:GntR family transcriptional regulator [Tsukamurella soli]|uniref:GntR family transcriptional regulator n=1 Tax=Tsukamurella soli TaxID=644556 RepID=A0ABP8K3S5_9ACTN
MLRDRMASGRLRPGDRAPSTRAIVREFGVAMATASKVLARLRDDGLVATAPGRGTVVLDPSATARRPDALTVEAVVAAAVAVADAEGLDAVSMRRVGADLGVSTMALYRYVSDKDDLVLRMMDAACAELAPPVTAGGWRERLELVARELWSGFRRHPWFAGVMSMTRPQPVRSAIPFTECALEGLRSAGLGVGPALTAYLGLMNLVRGLAINIEAELAEEATSGLTADEWQQRQNRDLAAALPRERFPRMHELLENTHDFDLDDVFEAALTAYLDGLVVQIWAVERRRA